MGLSLIAILMITMAIKVDANPVLGTKLYIDPSRIPKSGLTGHPSDVYDIAVKIEKVENLWAVGFTVKYAPYGRPLVVSDVKEGDFLKQNGWPTFFTYQVDMFRGELEIGITRMTDELPPVGAYGDGTLVTFRLTVTEAGSSPIDLVDDLLLNPELATIPHKTESSYYYGATASLVRVEVLPGRTVKAGENITFWSTVRNNGDIPLWVRVRFDVTREDGRIAVFYAGQTYYGGFGEQPPTTIDYLYVNNFTGYYGEDWGWHYEGTSPYLDAVGDNNYIWTNEPDAISGRYDFQDYKLDPEYVIDSVAIEAYTKCEWGLDQDNDLDVYMRKPWTEEPPTQWIGSLWGDGTWGWHTVRWTEDTIDDIFPEVKTEYGLNGTRVRFLTYYTTDGLPHGIAYIDAMRLKVTTIPYKWGVKPESPPMFLIPPRQEMVLPPAIWVTKLGDIGKYYVTANVEYTNEFSAWMRGDKPKTFTISIVP